MGTALLMSGPVPEPTAEAVNPDNTSTEHGSMRMGLRSLLRPGAEFGKLAVLLQLWIAFAPQASAAILVPEAAIPLKVLVIGDSLSVHNDGTLPPRFDRSWSFLLQQANPGVDIVNIAYGGTDTRYWTSAAGLALIRQHDDADYVLTQLGAIDSSPLGGRIPVAEFNFRLAAMANEFAPQRVWVTPTWNTIPPNSDPTGDALKAGYENFIRAEAGSRWNLGPDLHFMSSTEFLFEDGVHANQKGQIAYARAMADTVPFLVPEPASAGLLLFGLLVVATIRAPWFAGIGARGSGQ